MAQKISASGLSQTQADPATPGREVILRASGIRKSFRMGDSVIEVLKHVDLSVREGEFIAIEGRSGSGKSTLLHILGALESVDGGRLEFEGVDYTPKPPSGLALLLKRLSRWTFASFVVLLCTAVLQWILFHILVPQIDTVKDLFLWAGVPEEGLTWLRRSNLILYWLAGGSAILIVLWLGLLSIRAVIYHRREKPLARRRNSDFGFVFQFYHLLPELNVLENAAFAAKIGGAAGGISRSERIQRARDILAELGLGHRLRHRPQQLSGGERQRVAIARALMNQPKVLFADEPTGNLDSETGRQIMDVLETLHREHNQTIIMVTHDRALAREADRVLVLTDGRLEKAQ